MRYKLIVLFLISSIACAVGQRLTEPTPVISRAKPASIVDFERQVKHYRYLNPDSATYLAKKGIEFARHQSDSSGVALMLVQLGMIDDNKGKFEESDKKYRRALGLFKKADSKKILPPSRYVLALWPYETAITIKP
ncbi:hypothetical protein [Spirosoma sp. KNUC1025]|uniref:hypothetical protein n=1 Tax=Spirosoma sp. KNUC1025 TaxID=2894082 RepID=UPI0038668C17|nr:hypothetical protein LN737_09515 [Spirosoma sp. KNUC1025]